MGYTAFVHYYFPNLNEKKHYLIHKRFRNAFIELLETSIYWRVTMHVT